VRELRNRSSTPIIDVPAAETWGGALMAGARSCAKSFRIVFRLAFPPMILAAVLDACAVELIPQPALTGQVSVIGIVAVGLIAAFLPLPMAFDFAIAHSDGDWHTASV
jgi:hypothetical protein